jgi:hypothetical protein
VLQEAHQEVIVGVVDWLQRLQPDASGEGRLGAPPAPLGEARDFAAAGVTTYARQRLVDALDADREVVEQDWLGDDRF